MRVEIMDDLRKRILLDLLVTPGTIIPGTIGVSLLLLSEMLGGMAAFVGFCFILGSIGACLTNLVFNMDKISKRAIKEWQEAQAKQRESKLDELDSKLVRDRDPRDQNALRNLRTIYKSFVEDLQAGKLASSVTSAMMAQIDEIFNTCIHQLERQYEIWETAMKVTNPLRDKLLKQRDEIVVEVEKSVTNLADVVNEVRALKLNTKKGELEQLQQRLNTQLEAAKATEQFVAGLDADDMTRFAEYTKQ